MIEDIGMRRADRPDGFTSVLAAKTRPPTRTIDLLLYAGPAIHTCTCISSHATRMERGKGGQSVHQLGSTVLTLLVPDLDAEMHRLRDHQANVRVERPPPHDWVARRDPRTSRIRMGTSSNFSNTCRSAVGTTRHAR